MLRLSLQLHKWIGLAVGVQVFFWVLGGLVMTVLPIERVHGDQHLGQTPRTAIPPASVLPLTDVAKRAEFAMAEAALNPTPNGPVWVLTSTSGQEAWYNATTGAEVQEITPAQAVAAAAGAYRGSGKPEAAKLLDDPPPEAGAGGPLWSVRFNDGEGTTLYIDTFTGKVVSRRSDVWRFYDFFYRLHIMNFGRSENYNHPTIVAVTALTLVIVLTGFVLLWIRLGRDLSQALARRNKPVGF